MVPAQLYSIIEHSRWRGNSTKETSCLGNPSSLLLTSRLLENLNRKHVVGALKRCMIICKLQGAKLQIAGACEA
jgi:hypothetical protein